MNLDEIITHWKKSDIKLNNASSIDEILELEKILNFKSPSSFKYLYSRINGFKDYDSNEHIFTIYPLERIQLEYFENQNINFIPFCDYLINSHQIGFSKLDSKIYINYNTENNFNDLVANTFEESLVEIINNSDKIY